MRSLKKFIETGRITNTHGTDGEVKVELWCDSQDVFSGLSRLYLDEDGGEVLTVVKSRPANRFAIVRFEEAPTIDDAIRLKGRTVYCDRSELNIPPDRYLLCDIVGLDVLDAKTGERIGAVAGTLDNPANLIYVVKREGAADALIPAVDEFIARLDMDEGIYINVLPGLLD